MKQITLGRDGHASAACLSFPASLATFRSDSPSLKRPLPPLLPCDHAATQTWVSEAIRNPTYAIPQILSPHPRCTDRRLSAIKITATPSTG